MVEKLGGKAANLARLELLGLAVPPWYAVTTDAFESAREAAELDPGLEQAIERAHAARIGGLETLVAVRSSAVGEDAAGESFAGLHDSFLFVKGREALLDAIRRVWASAFNERALAYRRARNLPLDRIAIAVVVQQMVDARSSGVLFTANPNDGNVHEIVISALWGAGEGLVSAGLDADTWIVDKESLAVAEQIAEKREELVLDRAAGQGLAREEVPAELRSAPSLSRNQVEETARAGLAIERHYRRPQDVEFSIDEAGRLWILQARPVTTVEEVGPAAGNRLLWDNSNIIESYSGVTSPMTFSFIRRAYSIVYHCFAEVMGIGPEAVRANRDVFDNMLGLFRGQVYYNLHNWYRLVRLFPGFNYNKSFMESMMGVREGLAKGDQTEEPAPVSGMRRYTVELPALLRLVGRSVRNFLHIRRIVGDFEAHFRERYGTWSAMDFRRMAPHELAALYRKMEDQLLWEWKAPIINDFFVMIFYGTLKKLSVSWCGDEHGSLQNDLIAGEGGIESTEPTKLLLRLAVQARQNPALRQLLLETPADELARRIPADPRWTEFAAEIARYLDLYGFRCVNELKLEESSLRDRPAFLYQILRNYLAMEDPSALDVTVMEERERKLRSDAEARAFAAIRSPWRRWIFRRVLRNARLGVKNRENLRFARTRIYGLLRELLRAIGEDFAREGLLNTADDIFYLEIDEVWDFIRGRAVTTNLKGLSALRRAEFDAYRREVETTLADRFETFGLPYHRNRYQGRPRPAVVGEDGVLRGIGCCPGVVTGPVKVLRTPSEDARLDGEILVAERTDPGWVPLYPSVSGLLIERGSILSHSAIVAREMGIPTIVGIPGLVSALETGQVVTMDGAAGTVIPARTTKTSTT
ncbi:MAG TPA: PEP/pyruvate-binding domain-containing protein [Thermoanaerobaculia bacterium]|nr:PEP/pyruvate-binding domain-containing protein [Thermoanaerobaculia bacterium]